MFRSRSGRLASGVLVGALLLALTGCTATTPAPAVVASGTTSTTEAARTTAPPTSSRTPTPSTKPVPGAPPGFDTSAHSLSNPRSIWVVVDKKRPLQPKTWIPRDLVTPAVPHTNVPQLRKPAAAALVTMFAAAKRDGVTLVSLSAYRSYATQQSIFERNTASLGKAKTVQLTAKPGYSEHQTGLADDLGDGGSCDLQVCFESHRAAKWLSANSWRYGFIQRYPPGYTKITGIQVEPWHFRYIGLALATEMHRTGVKTLEQFFDLPPSPDY